MSRPPLRILVVDDDPDDVELTRQLLSAGRVPFELECVPHGEAALERLKDGALPDLILLDLHMPVMDGRQVLRAVKADPRLKAIPVVILTTSNAAQDVADGYELGASAFVSKALGVDQFPLLQQTVEDYWVERRAPGAGGPGRAAKA